MVTMVLVWAAIAAAVAWMVMTSWRERGVAREQRQRSHDAVTASLDEDVSALDDDLWRLGRDLADAEYDGDARRDYERASAINDAVRGSIDRLRLVTLADAMTEALAEARYATACARSRLAREAIPERRPPCFFNPRHGPSVADVRWAATPDDDPLEVPACAADAARIDAAEEPDSLRVWTGSQRVPYWEATVAFYAYAAGHFSGEWTGSTEGAMAAIKACMVDGAWGVDGTAYLGAIGAGGCGGDGGGGGGGGC